MGSRQKTGPKSGPKNGAAINKSSKDGPIFGFTLWPHFWVLFATPFLGPLLLVSTCSVEQNKKLKRLVVVLRAARKTANLQSAACPAFLLEALKSKAGAKASTVHQPTSRFNFSSSFLGQKTDPLFTHCWVTQQQQQRQLQQQQRRHHTARDNSSTSNNFSNSSVKNRF